jgi:putative flippase GtrA
VGLLCAALQLLLLAVFIEVTPLGRSGNIVAFLISAEVNVALSALVTWPDRYGRSRQQSARRLAMLNALLLGAAAAHHLVFLAIDRATPYVAASAIALLATSAAKYLVADRLIFRHPGGAAR